MIERQGGERIRFFLLRTHYRSTVVFSEEAIEEAGTGLETFDRFFERYERITGESFYDVSPSTSRTNGAIDVGDDVGLLLKVKEFRDGFLESMDDDFNTGAAIATLFEFLRYLNRWIESESIEGVAKPNLEQLPENIERLRKAVRTLRELTAILGLFLAPVEKDSGADDALVGELMQLLIDLRQNARKNKDFATADQIRDRLAALKITIEDRKEGTTWRAE